MPVAFQFQMTGNKLDKSRFSLFEQQPSATAAATVNLSTPIIKKLDSTRLSYFDQPSKIRMLNVAPPISNKLDGNLLAKFQYPATGANVEAPHKKHVELLIKTKAINKQVVLSSYDTLRYRPIQPSSTVAAATAIN